MAVSISGDKLTLVTDCEPQSPVSGQGPRLIRTDGLTMMGTQDSREETFEVWSSVAGETEAEARELCLQPKLDENREGESPAST